MSASTLLPASRLNPPGPTTTATIITTAPFPPGPCYLQTQAHKMQLSFPTTWSLTALLAGVVAAANATSGGGVLEVDVMFPRNDTYMWNDTLPVVFAIQNSALAMHLNLQIIFHIFDLADESFTDPVRSDSWTYRRTNLSANEPNFVGDFFSPIEFGNVSEGRWRLLWTVAWQSCDELANFQGSYFSEFVYSRRYVDFTIHPGAQPVDLVAATADGTPCPADYGVAINVTSPSIVVPPAASSSGGSKGNYTCASVNTESPTATPNPCRVKVDPAVVASFSASRSADMCSARPGHCGSSGGSQPLAVASVAGLGVLVGLLGFFLV